MHQMIYKTARYGKGIILLVLLVLIVLITTAYLKLPATSDLNSVEPSPVEWPENTPLSSANWSLFVRNHTKPPQNISNLAGKYRLAGTFFTYAGTEGNQDGDRKAIIDNLTSKQQYLLSENSHLDHMQVKRILRDHIVLSANGKEEVLWLSFSGDNQEEANGKASPNPSHGGEGNQRVLAESQFGKQVGDNRWVLQRESLIDYYEDLLDDPERLANIYISLAPNYNDKRKIEGYTLDITGEKNFFNAVGLRQNDVIIKVNSMRMTSQARAEYFLSEFAKNRVSALVLDIERDNEPTKLIYLIR